MIKHLLYGFLIIFLLLACISTNPVYYPQDNESKTSKSSIVKNRRGPSSNLANGKEGACYAKCLISPAVEEVILPFYEYTGSDYELSGVLKTEIIVQEASSEWVKRKADKNCLSANPDDCLVWCKVDVPAIIETYYEVIDTNSIKDFRSAELEYNPQPTSSSTSTFTEWREVVCDKDVTYKLVEKIHVFLAELGYKTGEELNFNSEVKASLKEYQKKHNLPVGALDFETLKHMGISVN